MAAASQQDMESKIDQILQDFFFKSIQIILQSRIPATGQSSAEATTSSSSSFKGPRWDRRFNLAMREFCADAGAKEVCMINGFRSIVLDVLLVQSKHQQAETVDQSGIKHGKLEKLWRKVSLQQEDRKSVLERWILQYVNHDYGKNSEKNTSLTETKIAKLYKSIMILLRSLCSVTKLLPSYGAFQLANNSSYGKFVGLTFRFLPLPRPLLHGESIRMKSYKFTPIDVPLGKICLSVDYRPLTASDLCVPPGLKLPVIMTDYKRNQTAEPIKKLSDYCSTNMMLNFGGFLPLAESAPPSLSHDSYRDKNLNYASTSCRHSYPQRALLMPLSCRRSFCMELQPEEQLHQFARHTKMVARSFSRSNTSCMTYGACNSYWNEAEADNLSLPFAIDHDDSHRGFNSFISSGRLQTNKAMANETTTLQMSMEGSVGALVDLLQHAPPLQQFTKLDNSQYSLMSSKPFSQNDGNIDFCPSKSMTSGLPMKSSYFVLSNFSKEGKTSSCSKLTFDQALKELDMYKDTKNWILTNRKMIQNSTD